MAVLGVQNSSMQDNQELRTFEHPLTMDSIFDICDALESVSLEECQQVIDNPQDTSATSLVPLETSALRDALQGFKRMGENSDLDASATARLKRLCAHTLLSLATSSDVEGECAMLHR